MFELALWFLSYMFFHISQACCAALLYTRGEQTPFVFNKLDFVESFNNHLQSRLKICAELNEGIEF